MANELSMDQTFIKQLDDLIEAHLEDEQFGVKELAQELGLSRSQLHRKLNGLTGKSTSQYIREYRLGKAMEMLHNNVATASEIAYRVGFGSPTYFNTSFNKYYGYPPGEVKIRASLNNEDNEEVQASNENSKTVNIKRKYHNKRTYLIGVVAIILVTTFTYLKYLSSKTTETTENESLKTVEKSIAVLPFKNYSGNADMDPFCFGMTDEVISRLTKIKSISKVISRTSVLKYKETGKNMPEIAEELGVTYILEGNFQKSGDKIKINLQLIHGPSDNHLWSDEYSGEWNSKDIFKIQSDVAENVAKHMDVRITDLEKKSIQQLPTKNKKAYNLYLQAEFQKYKFNKVAFENAIPLYQEAIALDSTYLEAYVGLADIYIICGLMWAVYDEQVAWNNARSLLQKALEIDPTSKVVEDELNAGYFYFEWNFDLVEKYYQNRLKQITFDKTPGIDVDYVIKTGRFKDALITLDKYIAIDPSVGVFYTFKAKTLMFLNKIDEAKKLLEIKDPLYSDDWFYLRESTKYHYYLSEYEKFRTQLKRIMNNFTDRPPIILWCNAVNEQMQGNDQGVSTYLSELNKRYEAGNSGSPAWFIAMYNCHIRDYEKAFEWLQKSFNRHEVEMTWLREEPLLIPLRNDYRYKTLYKKVGFPKTKQVPFTD